MIDLAVKRSGSRSDQDSRPIGVSSPMTSAGIIDKQHQWIEPEGRETGHLPSDPPQCMESA